MKILWSHSRMLTIGIWIFGFCLISVGQYISVDSGLVAEALFLIKQVNSTFVFYVNLYLSQLPAMALRFVKCWSGRQVGTRLSRSWRFLAPALGEANMHGKSRDKGRFFVSILGRLFGKLKKWVWYGVSRWKTAGTKWICLTDWHEDIVEENMSDLNKHPHASK